VADPTDAAGLSRPFAGDNDRMSVDCAVYVEGSLRARHGDLDEAVAELDQDPQVRAAEGSYVWIDLVEPSRAELDEVAERFDLHPLAVEDAISPTLQRPKLERYGTGLFLVLRTLRYDAERLEIEPGQLSVFLGADYCVTVREGPDDPITEARRRLGSYGEDAPECGPSAVLHAVCDTVVDRYTAIARSIEDDIDQLEGLVFMEGDEVNEAELIYRFKREVLEFRRASRPLVEPMARLARGDEAIVHPGSRAYFRDIADHVVRVVDLIDGYDTQLTDMLNANLAQVSVQQNDDMRKISAWAAMITVPTFLAGLYGMNFQHMPELGWRFGYPAALTIMAIVCLALHRAFRRSGWL
jgi:magnesium transporter